MSRRKAWPRVLAGAAALLLTVVALLYTPIAVAASHLPGMEIRTRLILAVVILSAISTWMLVIRPESQVARVATNLSSGFNLIWIFSFFVGLPVVLVSLLAGIAATVPAPRRLMPLLIAVAVAGFVLGLLLIRLTEPPGEHLFG